MKRTIVYSVLVCTAVAVAYLPPKPRVFRLGATFVPPEREFARRIAGLARWEADALILLEQRDRAMAQLDPLGPHLYYADASLPTRLDSATRSLLDSPDSLPTLPDAPRIAVAVVADTARVVRSVIRIPPRIRPRIYHLPPTATDGRTCLTIAAVGADIIENVLDTDDNQLLSLPWTRARLLGLCEFYHRFGQPSAPVEEWLLGGGLGSDGNLQTRCGRDDLEACELLAFPSRFETTLGGIRFAAWNRGPLGFLPSFDSTDEQFLNATIDSLSADTFQRFWRDPRPVDVSFQANLGVPFIDWVQSWYARSGRQGPRTGPLPSFQAVLLIAATIVGSLIWAVTARSGLLSRIGAGGRDRKVRVLRSPG